MIRPRGKFVFVNRFFHPDESATSQLLTDLAQSLAREGFWVHVICSRQLYTDPAARLPPTESLNGVSIHRVPTTRYGRSGLFGRFLDYASFYVSACWTLLKLVESGDVVISKTDPPLISIPAAVCARLKGAALVNWQQDVFPEVITHLAADALPRWLPGLLRSLRDWSMRRATINVLIGHRMLEYFRRRGIPSSKLCVIENWADGEAIAPKPPRLSALRARLGLAAKFVVCYSGNLGRAHEFETLVAAADLLRSDPSVVFLIIGGGAKMESLQRAVKQRALDSFLFLPYQSRAELEDSLAAGDVHLATLLPGLEGLIVPSKLYGIMAASRPLIFVGDSDGEIARVVRAAECGVTVAINATESLAAAIRRLQSEPRLCVAMGERARDFFLARYSRDATLEKWRSVLLQSARRPAVSFRAG